FNESLPVFEDTDLFIRLAIRGPFAYLRRRTVVRQVTVGSLRERGRRGGDYVAAFESTARDAVVELQTAPRAAPAGLLARAQGRVHYGLAMRALEAGDERAARASLAEACRLMPDLSMEAGLVASRMKLMPRVHEPAERLRYFETAARIWPEPLADTALFMRGHA